MDFAELGIGFTDAKLFLERAEDFSLLDGVNAQICFKFIIEFNVIGGVSGLLSNDRDDLLRWVDAGGIGCRLILSDQWCLGCVG